MSWTPVHPEVVGAERGWPHPQRVARKNGPGKFGAFGASVNDEALRVPGWHKELLSGRMARLQAGDAQDDFHRGTEAPTWCQASANPVEVLAVVQTDLEHARSFYESWKPGGGEEILRKYFEAVEWNRVSFLSKHADRLSALRFGPSAQTVCVQQGLGPGGVFRGQGRL
jgi:hypothetical protein